jgi:hypothetical protein
MSKSRILSGLVSDGGALADGQLTAQDIGAQPALVSGSTIKTLNGASLLGSGDITVEAGGGSGSTLDFGTFMAPPRFTLDMGAF